MRSVLGPAAVACTAGALLSALACLARTRQVLLSLTVLLALLLAAGLLRLGSDPTWHQLGAAAAVVAVRRLASAGLRQAAG